MAMVIVVMCSSADQMAGIVKGKGDWGESAKARIRYDLRYGNSEYSAYTFTCTIHTLVEYRGRTRRTLRAEIPYSISYGVTAKRV